MIKSAVGREEARAFQGFDLVIAILCLIGGSGSILLATIVAFEADSMTRNWFLWCIASVLCFSIFMMLNAVHQRLGNRPQACPVLWRLVRRTFHSGYHYKWFKESVPGWQRALATSLGVLYVVVVFAFFPATISSLLVIVLRVFTVIN